jgi:hypothetical protein
VRLGVVEEDVGSQSIANGGCRELLGCHTAGTVVVQHFAIRELRRTGLSVDSPTLPAHSVPIGQLYCNRAMLTAGCLSTYTVMMDADAFHLEVEVDDVYR